MIGLVIKTVLGFLVTQVGLWKSGKKSLKSFPKEKKYNKSPTHLVFCELDHVSALEKVFDVGLLVEPADQVNRRWHYLGPRIKD